MLKENKNQRQNVQAIIDRALFAIDALEQYNNALHKLEENFLSESEAQVISYGDVRDTIGRLVQTKELLENAIRTYEEFLALDGREQKLYD